MWTVIIKKKKNSRLRLPFQYFEKKRLDPFFGRIVIIVNQKKVDGIKLSIYYKRQKVYF